ncbi:transmembrane protease serine 11B-like protein [Copidosoma floridanum]|uniref:transmembrane protease serine 11B-like protein n=1 Tax=Copidosoma floridanum TaxID=29053 RepID=UPI0006C988D4|nr:transmembrane protease serine 11B-like protein [Copidosoma floridanum]
MELQTLESLVGEKIVGGNIARYGDWTYHVSILVNYEVHCGGAIIGEYFVITAAHCIYEDEGFTNQRVAVLAGINDFFSESSFKVIVPVRKMYIPSNFKLGKRVADIAVLRLKKPLKFNENPYVSYLTLPNEQSYEDEEAIVTGFGLEFVKVIYDESGIRHSRTGQYATKMKFAKTIVMDRPTCQTMYSSLSTSSFSLNNLIVDYTHICAQVQPDDVNTIAGICFGDSGGPLVHGNNTLIGIVIGGPYTCDEKIAPGLYTRVSFYSEFIEKAMQDNVDGTIFAMKTRY